MTEVRALRRAVRPFWHSRQISATSASSDSPTSGAALLLCKGEAPSSGIWGHHTDIIHSFLQWATCMVGPMA